MATLPAPLLPVLPPFWGWTAYTPVIPKLYWDVYSQEERIKRLCMEYDKLTHYSTMVAETVNGLAENVEGTLEEFKKQITQQIADQDAKITQQLAEQDAKVAQQLAEMKQYIDTKFDEYSQGTQTYDITTGEYRPSYQAMRRLFQALSYGFKGEEQLVQYVSANMTVSQAADKTVYNLAYANRETITINDQEV